MYLISGSNSLTPPVAGVLDLKTAIVENLLRILGDCNTIEVRVGCWRGVRLLLPAK